MESIRFAVRREGKYEHHCIVRGSLGLYGSIVTYGVYDALLLRHQNLPKDHIIRALKACIADQPPLQIVIRDTESDKPKLARAAEIDLNEHLRFLNTVPDDGRGLQALLEHIHNEPIAQGAARPQWRLYVAPTHQSASRFVLAFACSHNIMDGYSGVVFHRALLNALQAPSADSASPETKFELPLPTKPYPPSLDQAGTLAISWPFFLKLLAQEFLPAGLTRMLGLGSDNKSEPWKGAQARPSVPTPPELLRTSVRMTTVAAGTVSCLLKVCKAHNARLTGLLEHVIARVLAHALHQRGQSYSRFICLMPLNLRRALTLADIKHSNIWTKDLDDTMASYASVMSEDLELSTAQINPASDFSEKDWEAARHTTEKLSVVSATLQDQPVGCLKYISDRKAFILKQTAGQASASFELSNLGVFSDGAQVRDGQQSWKISEFGFSQSADATGAAICTNAASAKGGALNVAVSWWPGKLGVDDETIFVEEVCTGIVERLERIAAAEE